MNKDWSNLTEENQIAEIIALSNSIPVYIFKHSTTCGISAQAKENVEISFKNTDKPLLFYYLDLLKYGLFQMRLLQSSMFIINPLNLF